MFVNQLKPCLAKRFIFLTSINVFWLITLSAQAELLSVVNPKSGDLSVLDRTTEYFGINYYDWGPGWSSVKREKSVSEDGDVARFSFENVIEETQTPFTIVGAWSSPAKDQLRFEAVMKPGGDSELVIAQFGLNPGVAFDGGSVVVTQHDGTNVTHRLPLGRVDLGEQVVKLELIDAAGDKTHLMFEQPTSIAADRQARITIAKDGIKEGVVQKLAFRIQLPKSMQFVAGMDAAQSLVDMTHWYRFDPPSPIALDSEWNMQSWLEKPAGKHGRIKRHGDKLVYNGKPIKLWGLNNSYSACAPEKELADKRADFYAAMGVNTVRLHKYADGTGWAGILTKESAAEFDPEGLDRMDYYVAALKERGIYTKLSPVFIVDVGPGDRGRVPYMDEFGPLQNNRVSAKHGSLYLSTELQDLLIDQVATLLRHTNPYTGQTYAQETAIAYVELYNEDSALFGGVTSVMAKSPTLRKRGGEMFAEWLKHKYETEAAFLQAWGDKALNHGLLKNQKLPQDENWSENRIYPAGNPWFFDPTNLNTSQQDAQRRLLDTMAFLYELQNNVYDRYANAIREAGYEGELIASNWQAGRMTSHFYNLHSDYRIGTIDRHNYFGGGRGLGPFRSASMLAVPGSGSLSSSLQQVTDRPFMLSEWIHVLPNEWGVEGPAIIGAYGMGLQGWDVSYAFQNADDGTFSSIIGGHSWDVTAPQFIGVFPAVSRQVLRGDVKESMVNHHRNVHIPSLDQQQIGFDEFVRQEWDEKTFDSEVFSAESLAVARGTVRFSGEFEATDHFDLSEHKRKGHLLSTTRELLWTPGKHAQDGHIAISTPGTQAVIGFAKDRVIPMADTQITPRSRFAAVYLSAQSPHGTIAKDEGILLTAIARARNEGMVVLNDCYLMSLGNTRGNKPDGPIVMEPVVADIQLKREGSPTIHILDHGGSRTGQTLTIENGRFQVDTARDGSPYYLIEYGQ
ncbi:glycoside hydrolase family 5 protein [Novipirellula artificiosorum]|uniref:Glycoside hydrolase family 42 N-terminal domain-containing protein n=1 Tax=Novipirellula artificiosorum TaxID=2528016 RepID=A0A5C6E2B8_9BACT|nr:glycoside hydrolase family 5 protein [Novipirellula artificiosorum]TWU42634.1 hypothetical protein Poly41_09330 [Novipirellula artificiosorum]